MSKTTGIVSSLPARPTRQGGDYRPHYAAADADAYMDALLVKFRSHCRHRWHRHSVTSVMGGNVVNEAWEICDHCGKERI
jgi:hypothetical protein